MKKKYSAVVIILIFVGVSVIPTVAQDSKKPLPTSRGNWLYVGGSGPGNYTKIQDAISAASDGDTVFVYDDSSPYVEYLTIDRSITLLGEARDTTIINGILGWRSMIHIIAPDVVVQGFSLLNHGADGIYIQSDNVTITGTIITDIGWEAVDIEDATHINISDNVIINVGAGVFFYNSLFNYEYNIISHNVIRNTADYGIYISGKYNIIHGNDIAPVDSTGILLHEGSFNNISYNTVSSPTDGIWLINTYNNILYRNNLTGNQRFGVILTDASGDSIFENNFMENAKNARIIFDLSGSIYVHHVMGYPILPIPTNWARNFWDKPRSIPYPIAEHLMFGLLIPGWLEIFFESVFHKSYVQDMVNFVRFDLHPAQEPYYIP